MSTSLPQTWFGWMVLPLRRYAEFRGRSGRREFWSYSAFLVLGYLAILGVSQIASEDLVGFALLGGWSLFFIVNYVPGLALTTRRLHDMNLSGALLIVIFAGLSILNIIGWLAYMIWMSLPGQGTENRHVPPIGSPDIANVLS